MSIRTERLAAVIQRDLGRILQQDYQPSGSFITVTKVDLSPDLMNAKVFVSIYALDQDKVFLYNQITERKAEIRKKLASKIRHQVRRIPELHFQKDESAEYAEKMDRLFTQIQEERTARSKEQE
ncbi:MAG TPA: 30S ribosome-binding factor RbfA [Balneolaceae bacterium]|nr:30S ribosome-binding factor RbfA [Balneolaceae bacterium]